MGATEPLLYRHAGGGMLRAAVLPLDDMPMTWPMLSDAVSCREWLSTVWALPGFPGAVRYASESFAAQVDAILTDAAVEPRQVRRVTVSAVRYVLRAFGRPTPFGLFAGVAPIHLGGEVHAVWGDDHVAMIRADTLWLDGVIERLEAMPALMAHLRVVFCDLVVDRGDRIEMPRGPGRVTVRNTAVVRMIRKAAATPIGFADLSNMIVETFTGIARDTVVGVLMNLVAQGVLVSNLRAPMTVTDPVDHLIATLSHVVEHQLVPEAVEIADELLCIQLLIDAHNGATTPHGQAELRARLRTRMRALCGSGRTPLAADLYLDCQVTVPDDLAVEMAYAASALMRMTRQPRPDPAWNDWCREFWDRYGTGALVPVTEAIHPDAGIGLPASYPGSLMTPPGDTPSHRDAELLRLAWTAVITGRHEVVLTDQIIAEITAETPVQARTIAPHVELGARIRAAGTDAVGAGDYTFTVHPAWSHGTLTSRFAHTVTRSGLDDVYAATPAGIAGALSVQMSFPPLYPHAENVARTPVHLSHVLSLGEHKPAQENVITLDDLGIVAVADGLHLVSISRLQVIEPQVFHALALTKQAPPLARFLATLTRGFRARYTEFDWGPAARSLPYLPRVRYRRAILSPATWHITSTDLAPKTDDASEEDPIVGWRHRWNCPTTVELHHDHRTLRLDLTTESHRSLLREHLDRHGHATLTETETAADTRWIGGHIHEIVMPFTRTGTPSPNLVTGTLPIVRNTSDRHRPTAHLPGSPHASWLYAQVFTHPERIDDILRSHLPHLLTALDGEPAYWFARYRGARETDHIRLRIRTPDPDQHAATALAVGQWGQRLCDTGAASRLSLATYRPEIGRYGTGPALDAAEAVFAADSHAVALGLRQLPPQTIHPVALTAIGMVAIADAFHRDPATSAFWLTEQLPVTSAGSPDRDIADQVATWATHGTLPDGSMPPAEITAAWDARSTAVLRYRASLPPDADLDQTLIALLHMHHNRARRIDRHDENACRRLARQAGVTRRAHAARSTR